MRTGNALLRSCAVTVGVAASGRPVGLVAGAQGWGAIRMQRWLQAQPALLLGILPPFEVLLLRSLPMSLRILLKLRKRNGAPASRLSMRAVLLARFPDVRRFACGAALAQPR